jgi:hypothetical protein
MNQFENLKTLFAGLEADAAKFYGKGNRSAAKRMRKALLEIKKGSHELRKELSPTKTQEQE